MNGAAMCLPCKCGHSERDHSWESRASAGLIHVGSCGHANRETSPASLQSPKVLLIVCKCRRYDPNFAAVGLEIDESI